MCLQNLQRTLKNNRPDEKLGNQQEIHQNKTYRRVHGGTVNVLSH